MTWFSHAHDEISESDLIAYHLHELPPRRERAVAQALGASAALAATSAAVETTLRTLKAPPRPMDQAAFTRTWAALQPALVPYAKPLANKPHWQTPTLAVAATAVLAAVGIAVLATAHHEQADSAKVTAGLAPAASTPSASKSAAPRLDRNGEDAEPTSSAITHRRVIAPLTPDFRGTVSGGIYHPAQPNQPPLVHPFALAPTTSPSPITATEPPQTRSQAITTLPAPITANQTATLQPRAADLSQTPTTPISAARAGKARHPPPTRDHLGSDVMLALGGTFITPLSSTTVANQPTQAPTHAIAAIAAFHRQFRPALGYRLTLSYTRPDFQYTNTSTGIFEAAGTYVVQGPHRGRLTTSADAGAALLGFLRTQSAPTGGIYRVAGVLGAGVLGASADYAFSKHWSARATYRAQIFREPDFNYPGATISVTTSVVVNNEPAVGIVYRFGKNDKP